MDRPTLPVHIGLGSPDHYDEVAAWGRMDSLQSDRIYQEWRPDYAAHDYRWAALGLDPRWPGQDTSTCVAAVEIGVEHNHGGEELERLYRGASDRDEEIVLISSFSATRQKPPTTPPWSVTLPCRVNEAEIVGRRLPDGITPRLAAELDTVERDLALRLLEHDGPWWSIEIDYDPDGRHQRGPTVPLPGDIRPILETPAGEMVAAVIAPFRQRARWFFVPDLRGDNLLRWLVDQALPAYAPGALLRTRAAHLVDPTLRTSDEDTAMEALAAFEADVEHRRTQLEYAVTIANEAAGETRDALLFGTGAPLVVAVQALLVAAGFEVEDLDLKYGTQTADLLASSYGRSWLIEVKGVTGAAKEAFVDDLLRHERTFMKLDGRAIDGCVLVVNHQTKTPPRQRATFPYGRPAFADSLPAVVIGTVTLFDWWRSQTLARLFDAVIGEPRQY